MDGLALAREIRRIPAWRKLPLVILNSVSDPPPAPDMEFTSQLVKPIKPAPLREVLLQAICGDSKPVPITAPAEKVEAALATRLPLNLLLVEDNPINQMVALQLFGQMGYQANVAKNGLEALQLLDSRPYDIIFMDVQMPVMDGLEATRQIRMREREKARPTPAVIIAMTANAMAGDREKYLASGMDDYLGKPVRLEGLAATLKNWGEKLKAGVIPARPATNPASSGSAPPRPGSSSIEVSPVNVECLMGFVDDDPPTFRRLIHLYFEQTGAQLAALHAAIQAGAGGEVEGIAHSCGGASNTCGMTHIVIPLRELEKLGRERNLTGAAEILMRAETELERIKEFFRAAPELGIQPKP